MFFRTLATTEREKQEYGISPSKQKLREKYSLKRNKVTTQTLGKKSISPAFINKASLPKKRKAPSTFVAKKLTGHPSSSLFAAWIEITLGFLTCSTFFDLI